jgi:hypothetical protein
VRPSDGKGVRTDVHALLLAELIDRVEEGFVFPFDAIRVDFHVAGDPVNAAKAANSQKLERLQTRTGQAAREPAGGDARLIASLSTQSVVQTT